MIIKPETLHQYLDWLENTVIPGFERSNLPPSWKAESIQRSRQQADEIRQKLENPPAEKPPEIEDLPA